MMKHMRYTLIACCALVALGLSAQGRISTPLKIGTKIDGTVTYGIKADLSLSNFWGGKLPHGMRNGGRIGIFAEFQPSDERLVKWSLQPELYFSSEGGKFTVNQALAKNMGENVQLQGFAAQALNNKLIFTTNYITLPIMVRYRILPCLALEAGPQVSFNVYSKAHPDQVKDADVDLDDFTHTVTFGMGVGCTYYVTNYIMVNARYNMDFTNTFNVWNDKNSNLEFGIAYRL